MLFECSFQVRRSYLGTPSLEEAGKHNSAGLGKSSTKIPHWSHPRSTQQVSTMDQTQIFQNPFIMFSKTNQGCLPDMDRVWGMFPSRKVQMNYCSLGIMVSSHWVRVVSRIRRPLVAVRGSAPRKLLQKIVVERWGTWRARLEHESCCFAWLEHGWLAGFQVLRCAKVCLAWGNLFFCF